MKISVFTLGCKTNLYESGQIIAALNAKGYTAVHGLVPADVFVLNTCAVTGEAERKSRQAVERARKLNPLCRVLVVGCAAEKNAEQFADLPNVTFVKGVSDKTEIAERIEDLGTDVEQLPSVFAESVFSAQERTRAFVKIQDGCNNFCSYCIVPYLRGRSRSRRIADIVRETEQVCSAETVLIGIDISQFGKDTGESLPQLFDALRNVHSRLRMGSLEARVVTDEFLESLTHVDFCPHFHLSLQSGCDSVLKRMNRKYTTEQYMDAVKKIRNVFPDAGITTDVIVGFCGETEEEFRQTYDFLRQVHFADIHVFPYSPREGTVAYGWQDTDGAVKSRRAEELAVLKEQFKRDFAEKFVGTTQQVLAERRRGDLWQGYTRQYLRVYFEGETQMGNIVNVQIKEPYSDGAKGEMI